MPLRERVDVGRAQEYAKIALRSALHHRNLDLVRNPYPNRVAATLAHLRLGTVLDVGANIGQYGSALRAAGFRGRLVSFEPLPDAFPHLERRARRDDAWTAVNTAVGAEVGELDINVSANSYSSSVLPMTSAHTESAPGSEIIGSVAVPVTTVRDIVAAQDVDIARTLLKIDTQGYEGPVLDGAGDLLADFAAVQLELSFVPLYTGQLLYDDLVTRLHGLGFVTYGIEAGYADPRTGRTMQCDGLFVRADTLAAAG